MPWIQRTYPYFIQATEETRLRADLARAAFRCASLDGRRLRSEQDLLDALGPALDFPSYYGQSWDAFMDCAGDMRGRVALLWKAPETLLDHDLHGFVRGVHKLIGIARDISEVPGEEKNDVQLEIFLISERPDFRNG
jgi:hypothetical protein